MPTFSSLIVALDKDRQDDVNETEVDVAKAIKKTWKMQWSRFKRYGSQRKGELSN